MRSRITVLAALLAALALLVGVVPASASPAPHLPTSITFQAPSAANVADSFGGGEGGTETGPYLAGSDTATNQCHRSATSPAELLAQAHLIRLVANAACSGATTANLTTVGQYGEPPQLDQVPANVRLIYAMIGGNDLGFGPLVICILFADCDQTPLPGATLDFIQNPTQFGFGAVLDKAYEAIKAKAPQARVVVTLYPPLAPPTGTQDLSRCPEFNASEVALGNQIQRAANDVIAAHARAHGFRVADAGPLFAGHDVCSLQPWFYRPPVAAPPTPGTYHPNLLWGRPALAAAMAAA